MGCSQNNTPSREEGEKKCLKVNASLNSSSDVTHNVVINRVCSCATNLW